MSVETWPRTLLRTAIQLVAIAWAYFAFLFASDVGLHSSASPGEFAPQRTFLTVAVSACALLSGVLLALASSALPRGNGAARRRVPGAVGAVAALAFAPFAGLYALLLSSSTWGNLAGSDFLLRNAYVDAIRPAWLWWLLTLTVLLVLHSLFGSVLRSDARFGRATTLMCSVMVPLTIIATMITSSLQTPS
jgi:hypothetical protein